MVLSFLYLKPADVGRIIEGYQYKADLLQFLFFFFYNGKNFGAANIVLRIAIHKALYVHNNRK